MKLVVMVAGMNYSPRYGQFRALLRKLREESGLTQTALSQKLGKPQTFVSKSELGERRIDFLETVDFCRACGVSVEQLAARLEQIEPLEQRRKRRSPRKMDSQGRLTG
jgi:transcriptional regulator with XRE-family HTH domain